jgi:hypothetical protein
MPTLKQMEARMKAMEHEIERLQAINAIQNLAARYEVLHTPLTMHRTPEIFALELPDCSMEISDWGLWVGKEAIEYLFGTVMKEDPLGSIYQHHLDTPMIQVAKDGKTAKGVWWSPGYEIPRFPDGTHKMFWCWGKYVGDFIKINGQWKVWHWHWLRTFRSAFEKSLVDDWMNTSVGTPRPHHFPDVKKTTFHHTYSTVDMRTPIPFNPEPYETWTDGDWWFGECIDYKGRCQDREFRGAITKERK